MPINTHYASRSQSLTKCTYLNSFDSKKNLNPLKAAYSKTLMMPDEYSSYLKIGAEVEVTSSNHSDRGALFPAKIVGSGSKSNSYMVEYIHRIEKCKKRKRNKVCLSNSLRKEENVGLLRPVAPKESNYTFKFGDNVDAFFDGGWWEGFITEEIIKGLRFGVYFRFARKQWNFEPSQLRVHREFVKGSWVPPLLDSVNAQEIDKEELDETKKPVFLNEGEEVEVRIDEDGFEGAWFGATIIKEIMGSDHYKFLVKHKSIKTDDDSEFLRAEVNQNQIRPCPPQVMKNCYYIKEQVEALYNEGWWEGEIFEILPGENYRVYFQSTDDDMIFKLSELRPHQVWIQDNWVINT